MVMAWMRFGAGIPGFELPTFIHTDMFFDRATVRNALDRMEYKALTKASLLVRRNAQKSIRKMGMAKPQLKEQAAYPGMQLSEIARQPGLTERRRTVVLNRIREIQAKPPSLPNTPPHTHTPYKDHRSAFLGFRRNLYNAYDGGTHSAVVGPSKKGQMWTIPKLHEFGGTQQLRAWVFRPQYPRYGKPIVMWMPAQKSLPGNWVPTGAKRNGIYPPRPYMRPALEKSRPSFPKFFEGAFSAGAVGG